MRYKEDGGVIVGLKFKKVRNKLDLFKSKFVISKEKVLANKQINY